MIYIIRFCDKADVDMKTLHNVILLAFGAAYTDQNHNNTLILNTKSNEFVNNNELLILN